jgi:hypothetical protein
LRNKQVIKKQKKKKEQKRSEDQQLRVTQVVEGEINTISPRIIESGEEKRAYHQNQTQPLKLLSTKKNTGSC